MSLHFEAPLSVIESIKLIKVPLSISESLSSRGMVMVQGTLNNITFTAPLEPDGNGSHWFEVTETLYEHAGLQIGVTVSLRMAPMMDWPEPEMPNDILLAIEHAGLHPIWQSLTTKARWEWLRWIRSTKNVETRNKRIEVACSKLQKGEKRPCCFDGTRCTVQEVSKGGVLLA